MRELIHVVGGAEGPEYLGAVLCASMLIHLQHGGNISNGPWSDAVRVDPGAAATNAKRSEHQGKGCLVLSVVSSVGSRGADAAASQRAGLPHLQRPQCGVLRLQDTGCMNSTAMAC